MLRRRSIALVAVTLLLLAAFALPLAGWAVAALDAAGLDLGAPAAARARFAPLAERAARTPLVARLFFRGPPPSGSFPVLTLGKSLQEESWHGRTGWRRS
jgi:hypothetical protein